MTDEEILALDNHSLNIEIAVHVVGWKIGGMGWSSRLAHKARPSPSTDGGTKSDTTIGSRRVSTIS